MIPFVNGVIALYDDINDLKPVLVQCVAIFTKERSVNRNEKYLNCLNKKYNVQISEFDIDCKACGSNFSPCVERVAEGVFQVQRGANISA